MTSKTLITQNTQHTVKEGYHTNLCGCAIDILNSLALLILANCDSGGLSLPLLTPLQQEGRSPVLLNRLLLPRLLCWVARMYDSLGGGRQEPDRQQK